jgi:serine/threonine-protein kinase HipA
VSPQATACWICLGELPQDGSAARYHPACVQTLFGVAVVPRVAFGRLDITNWADEHAGRLSISGYQLKGPAALDEAGQTLTLVERDGTHIVKPPQPAYPHIVENEHVTMRLGRLVGLKVAEHGLIELDDGAVAYLTRRFDRPAGGAGPRVHVVDFCQLAGVDPADKEASSAEECAALVRQYARPEAALALFQLFVFAYWVRNGDLHLKNLMLLELPDRSYTLAPAYDLLCTELYDQKGMILPVGGERVNIPRKLWLDFGERACGIEPVRAAAIIDAMIAQQPAAKALIESSALPTPESKRKYWHWLQKRSRQLAGSV